MMMLALTLFKCFIEIYMFYLAYTYTYTYTYTHTLNVVKRVSSSAYILLHFRFRHLLLYLRCVQLIERDFF
jgi:hypothetical protein